MEYKTGEKFNLVKIDCNVIVRLKTIRDTLTLQLAIDLSDLACSTGLWYREQISPVQRSVRSLPFVFYRL